MQGSGENWIETHFGEDTNYGYAKHRDAVWGGISAINGFVKPSNEWKSAGSGGWWVPKVARKDILEEWKALPFVHYDEINELINWKRQLVGLNLVTLPPIMYEMNYTCFYS